MSNSTTFLATVAKVQTLADGGLRFTLDVGEGEIVAAAEMMAYKRHGVVLSITVEEWQDENEQKKDETRRNKAKF